MARLPVRGDLEEGNTSATCALGLARGRENRVQRRVLHTVMHEHILAAAHRLSDDALLERLKVLAGRERDATVELVAHLAELHARKASPGRRAGVAVRVLPG